MRITQGCFSFLPDLTDAQITAQVDYCLRNGWAVGVEYTYDPHPRNTYWEMWGNPMFDLREAVEGLRDAFTPRGEKGGNGHHNHDVRAHVLIALLDSARTGAEVIDAITAATDGHWTPKPGAVYPTLQLLADEGLVLGRCGAIGGPGGRACGMAVG